jgi:hypothetical protein
MSMIHSSVLVPGTNKWPDADAVVTRDAHAVVTRDADAVVTLDADAVVTHDADAVVTREMITFFILLGNWDT